jgi:hypothetical protein
MPEYSVVISLVKENLEWTTDINIIAYAYFQSQLIQNLPLSLRPTPFPVYDESFCWAKFGPEGRSSPPGVLILFKGLPGLLVLAELPSRFLSLSPSSRKWLEDAVLRSCDE